MSLLNKAQRLFQQDNTQKKEEIKINNFEEEQFNEDNASDDVYNDPSYIPMQTTPRENLIKPIHLLHELKDNKSLKRSNITGLSMAIIQDSNLAIVDDLYKTGYNMFDDPEYNKTRKEFIHHNPLSCYFDDNNIQNIFVSLCNQIFEMACINFYSLYDISEFGNSEIGCFFDIKRLFYEKMKKQISKDSCGLNDLGIALYGFVNNITRIHNINPNAIINVENTKDMKKLQGLTNLSINIIENTAIAITQLIGNEMCMAYHQGLSTVLCDVIGIPNINMIYDVLCNNSRYLAANRNSKSFGEIATIYIEEYYYSKIYSLLINVIKPNCEEILKSVIAAFPFLYSDIVRVSDHNIELNEKDKISKNQIDF